MKKTSYLSKKNSKKSYANWIIVYIIMIALVLFTALPLIYVVVTAFKPLDELFIYPPRFFVKRPTLRNFVDLLGGLSSSVVQFTRYIFNSFFTTAVIVAVTVLISSAGAYGLVKQNVPFGNAIFNIIIAALMFSPHVTQIPSYLVVNKLKMLNTYWALIIPRLAVAYNFFLMKQFIEGFPDELLESARIDGAGEWKVFFRILMPNIKPAWSTLIVISFLANWNDYFTALIYTSDQSMKVLTLALQLIGGTSIARQGAMAAGTFLITAPTIIMYMIMQSNVLETMVHSGIKA
jgi:ABC-type glycerol-3-phosphate transport system permease component